MADWTTIPNSSIETGKPGRAIDGRALRDNTIAIAEGAIGAPRVMPKALSSNILGMFVYSGTAVAITNIGWVSVIRIEATFISSGNAQIAFSSDGGTTWGTAQVIAGFGATDQTNFAEINLISGASVTPGSTITLTVPANVNAVRFNRVTANNMRCAVYAVGGRDDV